MNDELKTRLDACQIGIASRGQKQPDDTFLSPRLWDQLRQRLQGFYRRATGEMDAVLSVDEPAPAEHVMVGEPSIISAAKRIFELFCGGPVDWSRHVLNDAEDNIFASADWAQAMLYAKAAIEGAHADHVVPGEAMLNIAKLAGEHGIRYPTNAAMQAFLDRIISDYEREWKEKLEHADHLQRLFDLQWKRTREAGELWRQAHPGNDLVSPDLGELVTWLMSRAALSSPMEGGE